MKCEPNSKWKNNLINMLSKFSRNYDDYFCNERCTRGNKV